MIEKGVVNATYLHFLFVFHLFHFLPSCTIFTAMEKSVKTHNVTHYLNKSSSGNLFVTFELTWEMAAPFAWMFIYSVLSLKEAEYSFYSYSSLQILTLNSTMTLHNQWLNHESKARKCRYSWYCLLRFEVFGPRAQVWEVNWFAMRRNCILSGACHLCHKNNLLSWVAAWRIKGFCLKLIHGLKHFFLPSSKWKQRF